jgi:AcrR family transcriptional regulator
MSVDERRTLLVDAAIDVMCREGVAHTTTRAIVAEAGMQIGVFHYCFRSKEELVLEVIRTISRRTFAVVTDGLEPTGSPADRIRQATHAYWADIEARPLQHLLSFELTHHALRQPGEEEAAVVQYAGYYAGLEGLLANIAASGEFSWRTPVDQLARFTLATIEGITIQWLVNRDESMTLRLLDQLADYLITDAGLVDEGPAQ